MENLRAVRIATVPFVSGTVFVDMGLGEWKIGFMGRPKRAAPGGWVYHVLNRANGRLPIFEKGEDYAAFERVLEEAIDRTGTRLLSY